MISMILHAVHDNAAIAGTLLPFLDHLQQRDNGAHIVRKIRAWPAMVLKLAQMTLVLVLKIGQGQSFNTLVHH